MRRSVSSILRELQLLYPMFTLVHSFYPGYRNKVWIFYFPGGSYQVERSVQSLRRRLVRAKAEHDWFLHLELPKEAQG